jgi:hypothetical protein
MNTVHGPIFPIISEREREREKRERGTQPAWLTKKNERIRRTEIGVQMKKVRLRIMEKNNEDGTA